MRGERVGVEYGPDVRGGYLFGYGEFYTPPNYSLSREELRKHAQDLGWSNGCPVAGNLTESNRWDDLYLIAKKYAHANGWFYGLHTDPRFVRTNPQLHEYLWARKPRLKGEKVGKHNKHFIPTSHWSQIAPMSGLDGYALPRLMIEITQERGKPGPMQIRSAKGLLLSVFLETGHEVKTFLARLSQAVVLSGLEPAAALHYVYSKAILEEENCNTRFLDMASQLEDHAPDIWRTYIGMNAAERATLQIAEIPE